MNWPNHFLVAFNLLYFLFFPETNILTIILFCMIFGLFLDLDFIIPNLINKKRKHHRTFVQEPFGLILIALPISLILSLINKTYFWLAFLPYLSHITIDYLSIHKVYPLNPFSKKEINTGFIKPVNSIKIKDYLDFKSLNENYVTLINLVILLVLVINKI